MHGVTALGEPSRVSGIPHSQRHSPLTSRESWPCLKGNQMSNWLKAIVITCLVTAVWMLIGAWVHYLRREEVIQAHTLPAFYVGPTQESVWITSLWRWPAVRSAGTRF